MCVLSGALQEQSAVNHIRCAKIYDSRINECTRDSCEVSEISVVSTVHL